MAFASVAALPVALASGAADHSLDSIAIKPAQVGPGYHAHLLNGGRMVTNRVTLDLCGFDFPSESLRSNRLQIDYFRSRKYVGVSNEVVRYRGDGALQALSEVRNAATHCPKRRVRSNVRGTPPAKFRVKVYTGPALEPDSLGLLIHMDARVHGKREQFWNAAVYQVRGNLLSGVYTFGQSAAAQRRAALRVAAESAKNLNAAIP